MVEFSIVCPIKDEVDLIRRTLPSFYSVHPSEVMLCLDKPAPKHVVEVIRKVAKAYNTGDITRIVEVERNPEFAFHQAWVRRKGFLEAKHDKILTTDIDLVINKNVLKAVELVGKNDVGLVSLSKFSHPRGLTDYWRLGVVTFLCKILHGMLDPVMATTTFTGLYALWKPYWLDSEPEEEIKKLVNPKQFYRGETPSLEQASAITGEDTFLRDRMKEKHKCVYLRDMGAIDLRKGLENVPYVQYMVGQYFASQGRSFLVSFGRAVLRAQPYYLMGYLRWLKEN